MANKKKVPPVTLLKSPSSTKRMGSGIAYSRQSKQIIMHVFNTLSQEDRSASINSVCKETSALTGVGVPTVHRARTEAQKPRFWIYSKPKGKKKNQVPKGGPSRRLDFRRSEMLEIRRKFDEIVLSKSVPSFNELRAIVCKYGRIGELAQNTIRRMCMDMDIGFCRYMKKDYLVYKDEMVLKRRNYLRDISKYREEGRALYFVGETMLEEKTTAPEHNSTSLPKINVNNCFVVLHAASEVFLIEGMLEVFSGGVNEKQFENWLRKLLSLIPKGSVIIMQSTLYNSAKLEVVPTRDWIKADIQKWLDDRCIAYREGSLKFELLHLVNQVKKDCETYRIESIVALEGCMVLRLPPFYDELNPFDELLTNVRDNLVSVVHAGATVNTVNSAVSEVLRRIAPQNWKDYLRHVTEQENKVWELDEAFEKFFEKGTNQGGDEDSLEGDYTDAEYFGDYW